MAENETESAEPYEAAIERLAVTINEMNVTIREINQTVDLLVRNNAALTEMLMQAAAEDIDNPLNPGTLS